MMIFGIGLAKTGTTSLAEALNILGYKTAHVECDCLKIVDNDLQINYDTLIGYNAIVGAPIAPFFHELDAKYPEAKFILTTRHNKKWLDSCAVLFTESLVMDENHKKLHNILFECLYFDKDKFTSGYEVHIFKVIEYFAHKINRLLILNIEQDKKWKKLCNFLDKPFPKVLFPELNVRGGND